MKIENIYKKFVMCLMAETDQHGLTEVGGQRSEVNVLNPAT